MLTNLVPKIPNWPPWYRTVQSHILHGCQISKKIPHLLCATPSMTAPSGKPVGLLSP